MDEPTNPESVIDPTAADVPPEPPIPPILAARPERELRWIRYVCQNPKCGAEDTGRFFPNEQIPAGIICWKCHWGMGLGLGLEEMITKNHCMAAMAGPVASREELPEDGAASRAYRTNPKNFIAGDGRKMVRPQ